MRRLPDTFRYPVFGAGLAAGAVTLLLLLEHYVVRHLQVMGALDRVAALYIKGCAMISLPGLLVARSLRISHLEVPGILPHTVHALTICLVSALFFFVIAWVLLRRRARLRYPEFPDEVNDRRHFIKRAAGLTLAGGAGVLAGYGIYVEPVWPRLRRLDLPLRGLPKDLEGARLIHLSDLHLGPYNSRHYLGSVMDRCSELDAHLLLVTGDFIHGSVEFFEPVARLLARVKTRHGTLAVLGNHDHWQDPVRCRRALTGQGIQIVENRRLFLGAGGLTPDPPAEGGLCLAGVGDLWEGRHDMDACFGGVDPATPRLLLSHNPDYAEFSSARLSGHRVDLMLAGHTHGGQVRLPGTRSLVVPSFYGSKYARGMVQGPAFPVFVTTGVGVTILPVRLNVRPEVVLFTLKRA